MLLNLLSPLQILEAASEESYVSLLLYSMIIKAYKIWLNYQIKNKKIKIQETQLPIRLESFLPSPVSYSINFFFLVSTVVTCWVSHRSSRINTFNLLGLVLMVVLFGADGIQTAILMNFIFLNVYRGGFQNVEPFIPLESCG